MKPDDPRHGTEAGCREHYRHGQKPCEPCLEAHRRRNIMRQLYPHKCPAIGSQRRIRALQALGHSRLQIARELGYSDNGSIAYIMRADTMLVVTAERIAEVYDRLCMTVPQGVGANRARTWARRYGYAPPLAWNDIDDPDEIPSGWQRQGADRGESLREMAELGLGITEAARRIGISAKSLQKWCGRHGLSATYRQLAAREALETNQHTRESDELDEGAA